MTYVPHIFLASALIAAVVTDLRERRVPNVLVIALFAIGLALQWGFFGIGGLARGLSGALAAGLLFLPLYLGNGMGGGDVKLMMAVGSFLGPVGAIVAAVCSLVLGGLVGLAMMIWPHLTPRAQSDVGELTDNALIGIPYATVIAAGTLVGTWIAVHGSQPLMQLGS